MSCFWCMSFTSLVQLTPGYFILLNAIGNGIAFLILFWGCLALVCETQLICVCWSCSLQLCWLHVLALLASLCIPWLGFPGYNIILSVNRDGSTSFPGWMFFISCLIALVTTFCEMSRSGENGQPVLLLIFGGKFSVFVECDVSYGFFINTLCRIKENHIHFCFAECLYHERVLNFVKCLICICWDGPVFLPPCNTVVWNMERFFSPILNHPYSPFSVLLFSLVF